MHTELLLDKLSDDEMSAIFSVLDAFSLAKMLRVAKRWKAIASSDDLWARACRARWNLPTRTLERRPDRRPYISQLQGRAATWHRAYCVLHHLRRPPVLHDRAVYVDGICASVGCWLYVKHRLACKLPLATVDPSQQQPVQHRVLRVQVLLQNLRGEPLGIAADSLHNTCRGGYAQTAPADAAVMPWGCRSSRRGRSLVPWAAVGLASCPFASPSP